MEPTKYHNLYRTNGVFKYIYKEDNFEIGARDFNDLKFKLAVQGIELREKTGYKEDNIKNESQPLNKNQNHVASNVHSMEVTKPKPRNKNQKKVAGKLGSKEVSSKPKHLRKNIDYIESEDDVDFGKIRYRDIKGGVYETWGPDNSKRARKLRKELLR